MASAKPNLSGLASRIVVGLFLAVVAVVDVWIGGLAFAILVTIGCAIVVWEWGAMNGTAPRFRMAALGALMLVSTLAVRDQAREALLLLFGAIAILLLLSALDRMPGKRWLSTGLLYAGLPAVALIWLRGQQDGFALVIWTMGIVWATDTAAYFAGRAIGGAKLMPSVSPNKTWAGLIGGMAAAAIFSALFGNYVGWPQPAWMLFAFGAALAVAAQAGDLFESWLKRRAGVKDSGKLLAAHGGVMDRVDGLVPVVCLVALWVAVR